MFAKGELANEGTATGRSDEAKELLMPGPQQSHLLHAFPPGPLSRTAQPAEPSSTGRCLGYGIQSVCACVCVCVCVRETASVV